MSKSKVSVPQARAKSSRLWLDEPERDDVGLAFNCAPRRRLVCAKENMWISLADVAYNSCASAGP